MRKSKERMTAAGCLLQCFACPDFLHKGGNPYGRQSSNKTGETEPGGQVPV